MQYIATASTGEQVSFAVETLPQAFATIPDPRWPQGTRYSVAAILSLAVVAILANHISVLAMAEWPSHQTRHLRRALGFQRDTTPHQTTIQRLFTRLDPAEVAVALQRVFDPRTPGEVRPRGSQGVALDGKAQRGHLRHGATPPIPSTPSARFVTTSQASWPNWSSMPSNTKLNWPSRLQRLSRLIGRSGCSLATRSTANTPFARRWWKQVVTICCSSRTISRPYWWIFSTSLLH